MKKFLFTYQPISKYGLGDERHNIVTVSKTTGDIGKDAKYALGIFMARTGTLKKNNIVSIQEINEKGEFVGEPIKPTEGSAIIPTGR